MSETIAFDVDRLAEPREDFVKGVKVYLHPSPYDLPDAVFREYDPDQMTLTLRFRYFGHSEKRRDTVRRGKTRLRLGPESGRIYEIVVGPVENEAGAFQEVLDALSHAPEESPKANTTVVSAALQQKRDRLFDFLPAE